ncbi:MAG TPA: sigma-70 family RNA polymerase sigma factor [Polyangiaceae bacterium]|jgi:RNA polymerase sigma-70 factor (ECF subfamily)
MALSIQREIVQAALEGDRASLRAIVTTSSPLIERQLLRYPLSDDDRRDLVQTTLVQVLRRLGSFRGESSWSTWLFRVTANEALMFLRSQRRRRARIAEVDFDAATDAHADDSPEPDERVARKAARFRVATALAALPADYRDVVVAHYHEDLGLQEIAARLAITESAVRSRLHRARAALRTLLDAA